MTTSFFEIPLEPKPMDFVVRDNVDRSYRFLTQYRETNEGGWILDIDDDNTGEKLVYGIPLVTGLDLLWQFNHLNIRFHLLVDCRGGRTTPTFESLGTEDRLIAVYPNIDPDKPTPLEIMLTKIPLYAVEISPVPVPDIVPVVPVAPIGTPIGLLLSLTTIG